jgi:ribosomal protein L11 methyltransferase
LSLVRLGIRVRADRAEPALAELLPILAAGAEERELDGAVEYALYAPAGELPSVDDIRSLAGDALLDVASEPVPDGWERRWHEYLRPVRVGELVVRPPWIEGGAEDLVIDPGVYFGAGSHPTTRLCLRLLLDEERAGALCDWGAGTGVLAVVAARLGWDPVTAVELDPAAIDVIRANAERNGVAVEARAHDLRKGGALWAHTVVANLPKPVLLDVARAPEPPPGPDLPGALEPPPARVPRRLVAAGMLAGEADEVVGAFERLGLRERRRLVEDGWVAVVLG